MTKMLMGSVILAVAGQNPQFGSLGTLLAVLGALGGLGTMLAVGVATYKARADKGLTAAQTMEILFEQQRQVNLEALALRDQQIIQLRAELSLATGNCDELRDKLADCLRQRAVLENQIVGLERTLQEMRRRAAGEPDPSVLPSVAQPTEEGDDGRLHDQSGGP